MGKPLLRFKHLKQRRIVENWPQLKRLVERHGFPPGIYLSPNTRAWPEDEVDRWLESRPSDRTAMIREVREVDAA
jgi:predicted DNA-binding transcriptional regulator AlpA